MSCSFFRKSLQQNHRVSWAARVPVRIFSLVLHTALGKGCRRPIWDFSFPLQYPRSLEVREISGLVLNRADLLQNITDLKDLLMEAKKRDHCNTLNCPGISAREPRFDHSI